MRTSEIKTLKEVVSKAQRKCFILHHKVEVEMKAKEEVESDNRDLRMIVQSMKRRNCLPSNTPSNKEPNSKESLENSYRFLQKKYQERLEELERVEEELAKYKEDQVLCSQPKKIFTESFSKKKSFFRT